MFGRVGEGPPLCKSLGRSIEMSHSTSIQRARSRQAGSRTSCSRCRAALAVLSAFAVFVAACDAGPAVSPADSPTAAALDSSTASETRFPLEGETEAGLYRVTVRPAREPLRLHEMHDWVVGIELAGPDSPVPSAVQFDGGMPSHGHGFPTRPRVTRNLGGGEFLVEGVRFHMPGAWVVSVTVSSGTSSDRVVWPLEVQP